MPVSPAYRPAPQFAHLGPDHGDPVAPAAFPATRLRFRNNRAAATVGLDGLTEAEWLTHFGRLQALPGQPGGV
ncbi:MAG: selenoprotein O, partial [Brevundimonas sp.]